MPDEGVSISIDAPFFSFEMASRKNRRKSVSFILKFSEVCSWQHSEKGGLPMIYIKIRWVHDFPDEPIMIISELDDEGYENRKIEIFRDDRIVYATKDLEVGTFLAPVAYSYEEIAADPQFIPCKITRQEFEQYWRERVGGFF